MKRTTLIRFAAVIICCAALISNGFAADLKPIQLPEPKLDQGISLMQALKERKTLREYSAGDLSPQTLSNLLWAAFGVNRPDSGRRTAPSAHNRQEIDVYVAMAGGLYLYDSKAHALVPIVADDLRALTGKQSYFKDAALNLVYVADLSKMTDGEEADKMFLASADSGFIGQNVYLSCAAEGLATVFRAGIDKERLAAAMKLRPEQRIIFAQTVGLPKAK